MHVHVVVVLESNDIRLLGAFKIAFALVEISKYSWRRTCIKNRETWISRQINSKDWVDNICYMYFSQSPGSLLTPILGAMLGDGPIRMITGGQEFSVDYDEKTLAEVQLKDNQVGNEERHYMQYLNKMLNVFLQLYS